MTDAHSPLPAPLPSAVRDLPREEPPLLKLVDGKIEMLLGFVPHAKAIGMVVCEAWRNHAAVRVPFSPKLVGNPATGVIHGGVVTTILDNVGGIAVFTAMEKPIATATLDLRIDYMRPATSGQTIFAHAHCYKMTRTVAFVHGSAYNLDADDPIATCAAAFMLG